MTKNRSMKIAVLVLALALLTSCFVGSTFAKYSSTGTGNSSVEIAKWSVNINGDEVTAENNGPATYDLFKTTDNFDEAGDDVVDGKVAPGTKGSFAYTVANNSDVSVKYTVSFKVTFPAGLDASRFVFYSDAERQTKITPSGEGVYTVETAEIEVGDTATKTVNVYWEWTYANDVNDNALGTGALKVDIVSTIAVEQVD